MPPTPLCLLARKYGSDKFSAKHSYTRWYWDEFKDRRETVRKVVEIGVGEGASLRMWREFFPNAMIYGLEIDPARVFTDERITVFQGDQSSLSGLFGLISRAGSDIDLFIDDGTHKRSDQYFTVNYAMPRLPIGVTYVIEDVAEPPNCSEYWGDYLFEYPTLERRRRYDNRLLVVRHRA